VAVTWDSVRRVTSTAGVNDSGSGSRARGSSPSAASCISARMAKCASNSPPTSCRMSSGVLLRNTRRANDRCADVHGGGRNLFDAGWSAHARDRRSALSPPDMAPSYARFSGTSSAAPQVAAITALVIERFPAITGLAVRDRIRANADAWGALNDFGAGKANAYLSLVGRLTASINPPTLALVGVVTKSCFATNGLGSYTHRWYLSYTASTSDLFDTGVTTQSISQSMNPGENFLFRCVVSDGVQFATADRAALAQ
jgi:subtilisin family serine protease